ncbi:MAG: response regulator transcription factor [Eubacterium sp.]|nr:response regulator transcription factor [Eubacterium sp.]
MTERKLGNCPIGKVTEREIEVMNLLAHGNSREEISNKLNISSNTVKYHLKSILCKTGFSNTVMLVAYAVTAGLIEMER